MKKIIILLVPVIAVVCVFPFIKQLVCSHETKNILAKEPPPEVMCYDVVYVEPRIPDVIDLNDQLDQLEKLYTDKKIDEATYKIRKEDLLQKIDENH